LRNVKDINNQKPLSSQGGENMFVLPIRFCRNKNKIDGVNYSPES